ncbi:hypothetical protein Swit_4449 [Rhizorhabdus wittichii RW1]|uniref:Uncharacterized protein n=1 Tax=Rhizorhabdus wittichii (strain DSM 6014 / CCUG 31198 / JCM 15750 / NBRC 105917 / EY 4224 / RW1) TaxID=392499 RepID=A0A9J9LEJ3_RHIWR|nr:hypothetical protein Swit_4449 [Rhizorhabdus wittichii RW1]
MPVEIYRVTIPARFQCIFIVAQNQERLAAITATLIGLGATVGDKQFLEIDKSVDPVLIERALGTLEKDERIYFVEPENRSIGIGFEQGDRDHLVVSEGLGQIS